MQLIFHLSKNRDDNTSMQRLIVTLLLAWSWHSIVLAQTPEEILVATDKIRAPGDNFGFSLHVVQQRTAETKSASSEFKFQVRVKDFVKSLVTYTAPPSSKGKRLLMVGPDMWFYVPEIRHSIRISPQQQLLGQVSNADVARVVFNIDYRAVAMTEATYAEQAAWSLRLEAREQDIAVYSYIDLLVAKSDFRPLQAKFFTLSKRLLKTALFQDYQNVLGIERPMRLDIQDAINGKHVVMQYSEMQIMQTPDMYYNKNYLQHLQ